MKVSTKLILAATVLGSLGFGGLVYANQSKYGVAIIPQHNGRTGIAEASDGNGEQPDATEPKETKQTQNLTASKTQAVYQRIYSFKYK